MDAFSPPPHAQARRSHDAVPRPFLADGGVLQLLQLVPRWVARRGKVLMQEDGFSDACSGKVLMH